MYCPFLCRLRLKQPKYPVLFLSNGMLLPSTPVDIRGQTLNDATMFAKADKLLVSDYAYTNYSHTHNCPSLSRSLSLLSSSSLQGVDLDSASLLTNLDLVSKVTEKNLVLFTWGEKNDNPKVIELQKKRGVAAVIYNRSANGK